MAVSARLQTFAGASILLWSALAGASAQRTFVASTGADTNSCSLGAPCRSFARAMTQTSPGGEIIVLDSAGYGTVTITKAVSIIAPPGIYAGISVFSGNDGVTVNAPGATVVLRGLSINGQGGRWGVHLQSAARVRIESCVISNMASDGVSHGASGAELVMLDTIVRDNGSFGITVVADTSVVLDHVRSEHNQGSGVGIAPASVEVSATIVDSVFTHNIGSGIVVGTSASGQSYVQVERSVMSNNGLGFWATATSNSSVVVMLARNAINHNGTDGILFSGTNPGTVAGYLHENAVQANFGDGIHTQGTGYARISQNAVGPNGDVAVDCDTGTISTYNNNYVDSIVASCVSSATPQ